MDQNLEVVDVALKNGKEHEISSQEELQKFVVAPRARTFYEIINRRPLIDVPMEDEEKSFWEKESKRVNDVTLYSWRNDWIKNTKENIKHFGYFNRDHSVKVFAEELREKPIIIVAAGPSLELNIHYLREAKEAGIPIMATSHAYMYLANPEINIKPDFVSILDAGSQWIEYVDTPMDSSDIPLLAEQCVNLDHLKVWKGPIYFYKALYPTDEKSIGKLLQEELNRIVPYEKSGAKINVGGHITATSLVLGVTLMKANKVILVGCDYAFTTDDKFYPFQKTKMEYEIDKPSTPEKHGMVWDILGQSVWTNSSYLHFKNVLDEIIKQQIIHSWSSYGTPAPYEFEFVNATEGGILGAFEHGNSKYMRYMRLEDCIKETSLKMKIPKKGDK